MVHGVSQKILRRPVGVGAENPGQTAGCTEHVYRKHQVGEEEKDSGDSDDFAGCFFTELQVGKCLSGHAGNDNRVGQQHLFHEWVFHLNEWSTGYTEYGKHGQGKDEEQVLFSRLFHGEKGCHVDYMTQGE